VGDSGPWPSTPPRRCAGGRIGCWFFLTARSLPSSPALKRTFTGLRLLSGSDRITRTSDGVVHLHNQPDCGGGPSRDPGRVAKVAGRIGYAARWRGRGTDRSSLSALTKNQPCSLDDGLLLVACSVAPAGANASTSPHPAAFRDRRGGSFTSTADALISLIVWRAHTIS
jgi:hypothetical protein